MNKMKYDLHVHSKEVSPCGKMTIEEIIDAYEEAGYQGFWLTNHFHREFLEMTEGMIWKERMDYFLLPYHRGKIYAEGKMLVGLGMEIRFLSDPNDYLVWGMSEQMLYEEAEIWLSMDLKAFFQKYHNRLFIVQAHPNRRDGSYLSKIEYLHGLEAINASPRHENGNSKTQEVLCINPHLIPTAGSDSHRIEDIGRSGICTKRALYGTEDLIKTLKNREYTLVPCLEEEN